jgi:hypothetical protein
VIGYQTMSRSLSSVGYLASNLGVSVAKLLALAAEIGVRPAVILNGIAHYDEAGEEKIRQHVAQAKVTT